MGGYWRYKWGVWYRDACTKGVHMAIHAKKSQTSTPPGAKTLLSNPEPEGKKLVEACIVEIKPQKVLWRSSASGMYAPL